MGRLGCDRAGAVLRVAESYKRRAEVRDWHFDRREASQDLHIQRNNWFSAATDH